MVQMWYILVCTEDVTTNKIIRFCDLQAKGCPP